ncbi:hypothetical protein D3C73_1294580 [compost metagenome]
MIGRHAPTRCALDKTLLDQEGFDNVFDCFPLLANRRRQVIQAHWPAGELVDNRQQQLAVHIVKTFGVDVQHIQRLHRHFAIDDAIGANFGKVTHPAQ